MTCPECGKELIPIGYSIIDIVMGCPDECTDFELELMRDGTNEHLVRELRKHWSHTDLVNDIRNSHLPARDCDCGGIACDTCREKMSKLA